jgi:hypothetical protein
MEEEADLGQAPDLTREHGGQDEQLEAVDPDEVCEKRR